jgi:hypothetical protein
MPDLSRFFVRLRRRVLQAYDALLYAMLLALAAGTFIPASAQDPPEEPVQCGNIQSSTVVINR